MSSIKPNYATQHEQANHDLSHESTHTTVKEPVVDVKKKVKHVEEVQPVIHKDVEQTHVHPKVKHEYEHETEPTKVHDTKVHDTNEAGDKGNKSIGTKIKDALTGN